LSAQGGKASSTQKKSWGLTPQHNKRAKTIQNWLKNSKAHRAHEKRAQARHIFVYRAHMRGCGVKNPRAYQTTHL
jgi:hypothetical protein